MQKFSTQVDGKKLEILKIISQKDGKKLQSIIDEAIELYIQHRLNNKSLKDDILSNFNSSVKKNHELAKLLAK